LHKRGGSVGKAADKPLFPPEAEGKARGFANLQAFLNGF
jgi:hypothetical protein